MDNTGGLSEEQKQRLAAERIAREQVVDAYKSSSTPGHMSSEPVRVSREEWQRYHTAWQSYYQKYYNDYYSNAARDYIAKERLKSDRKKDDESPDSSDSNQKSPSTPNTYIEESQAISLTLREKIKKKASEKVRLTRRRKKLTPILMGVAVIIVILFLQYNRLIFAPIFAYVSPGDTPASEIEAINPIVTGESVSADPVLIIPKLNIKVPVSFGISANEVMSAMNHGVAHYRISGANAFPGEIGNTVITGHSAGDVYSANQYKYIFSGLERLSPGDLIYINYNSVRYTYKMTKSDVVDPTNVSALVYATDKPILTLITCTPLGTSKYRLLITAEQISPSYTNATTSEPIYNDDTEDFINLPANEPSFFEKIWNWLTGNS